MARASGHQIMNDMSMNIREPHVTTTDLHCQSGVIDSHEMQHRGMEIMDLNWFVNGLVSELVG